MIQNKCRRRGRKFAIAFPIIAVLLAGCGAPPPVEFGGNWQPVNRFQDKPQEIPLSPAYTYYASPLDNTLRSMLRRWAKDNAMPLLWQINSDYTLHSAVTNLRATDLQTAVSQLNKIYAAQGILITADLERILVQAAPASDASTAPDPSSKTKNPVEPAANALPTDSAAISPASGN